VGNGELIDLTWAAVHIQKMWGRERMKNEIANADGSRLRIASSWEWSGKGGSTGRED
jgi:hypothetical protein